MEPRIADIERVHDARTGGKCPEVVEQTALTKRAYPEMQMFEAWARQRAGKAGRQIRGRAGTKFRWGALQLGICRTVYWGETIHFSPGVMTRTVRLGLASATRLHLASLA